jgi:hypothetical protein
MENQFTFMPKYLWNKCRWDILPFEAKSQRHSGGLSVFSSLLFLDSNKSNENPFKTQTVFFLFKPFVAVMSILRSLLTTVAQYDSSLCSTKCMENSCINYCDTSTIITITLLITTLLTLINVTLCYPYF